MRLRLLVDHMTVTKMPTQRYHFAVGEGPFSSYAFSEYLTLARAAFGSPRSVIAPTNETRPQKRPRGRQEYAKVTPRP
jgi:hypothetical protein